MPQSITNIQYNLVFIERKSDLVLDNLNNGDIAFCSEDKSINLKMNDELIKFSQEDVWFDILDTSPVIGVALTGEYTEQGASLAWIDKNFNAITDNLGKEYFDSNPAFNFQTVSDSGNTMVKVPLAYWWRGIIPSGPYKDKWGMLIPTAPKKIAGTTMKPNYVAFMDHGTLKDSFAIGAYRSRLSGSKFVSVGNGSYANNLTIADTKARCEANGGSYSLLTIQAWHDICCRAVIERKSFMLTGTDAARKTLNATTGYRGIVDAFYSDNDTVTERMVCFTYLEVSDI